jgi:Cu/Zn superoxide dismutase
MKATRAFSLALVVAAIAACEAKTDEAAENAAPGTEPAAAPAAPAASTEPIMSADVQSEGGSQVSGKVEVLPAADASNAFRVVVNLQNVPAGEHAWHIHQGACGAKDTPVVVPFTEDKDKPALASPITAAADGAVAVEANVPGNLLTVDQLRSADYSLHVHQKGGTDHGPTIACATL